MRIVILISGRGSNLQAIVQANLPLEIAAVISNNPDAVGLAYARSREIPAVAFDHRLFPSREAFDIALREQIECFAPDLVVLAGYMRILSDEFIAYYARRLINIHPSLLPAYPGLNTHRRALLDGVKVHGCTVHFVTPKLDCGPIIAQAAIPVLHNDDEETLAARVLLAEHRIYPAALRWLAEGKVSYAAPLDFSDANLAQQCLCIPPLP